MNDHERALADAFIAECWPVVREYREGETPPNRSRKRSVRSRPEIVDRAGDSGEVGAA